MTELNLTELDRLERGVKEAQRAWHAGETDDAWVLSNAIGALHTTFDAQLRPLLDIVGRLGVSLEDAATALHADRAHEGKFWDCQLFGCSSASALITEWKQAKGC